MDRVVVATIVRYLPRDVKQDPVMADLAGNCQSGGVLCGWVVATFACMPADSAASDSEFDEDELQRIADLVDFRHGSDEGSASNG